MKVLPKPLKVIFAILLCILTLTASASACLGIFVTDQDYYNTPEQFIYNHVLKYQLDTDSQAMIEEVLTLWNDGDHTVTQYYLEQFVNQNKINVRLTVNDEIIYDTLNTADPLAESIFIRQLHGPTRQFILNTTLTELSPESPYKLLLEYAGFLYRMRYALWIIAAICLLFSLVFSLLLILSAGKDSKTGEAVCSPFFKAMPFSIIAAVFVLLGVGVVFSIGVFDNIINEIGYFPNFHFSMYILPLAIGICLLLLVWLCCLFAAKVRSKTLLNTLILWRIGKFFYQKLILPLSKKLPYFWQNLSLWWKGGLVLGGITMLDALLMLMLAAGCADRTADVIIFAVGCLILLRMALIGCGVVALINLQQLKQGALRIKEGGLQQKIETVNMYWEFKSHADTLNSIGDGVRHAVNERMKSERFQHELITNVSHDIKTPMTSIINYIDLLGKLELEDETAKEYIEVLTRQSARLKKLTEDLVEASKAQSGTLTPVLEPLDLAMATEQALGEYTDRMEEVFLTPILHLPEKPVFVMADGKMLWRVLDNLFSNVVKYALPQTRVFVEVSENGKLTVKNISKQQLDVSGDELAKRFVRGDTSRTGTGGSGLGLSIATSLTELMVGSLNIIVDGDLFKAELTLPVTDAPVHPSQQPDEIKPVPQQ